MIKLMNLFLEVKSDYDKWLELDKEQDEEIANAKEIHLKLYSSGKIKDNPDEEKYAEDAFNKRIDAIMHKYNKLKDKLYLKTDDTFNMRGNLKSKYIYHYTTGYALYHIIEENKMEGRTISFSTNNNLYKRKFIFSHPIDDMDDGRTHENVSVKIKLDLKKMIDDGFIFYQGDSSYGTYAGEEELYLKQSDIDTGNVDNVIKYIVEIFIISDKEFDSDVSELEYLLKSKNIRYKIV